jgi:protein-disulfide isomerase
MATSISRWLDRGLTALVIAAALASLWIAITGRPIVSLLVKADPPVLPPPQIPAVQSAEGLRTLIPKILEGDAAAEMVLLEFSDFECPFCGRFFRETYKPLVEQFVSTGKVRYGFKHFPLGIHTQAIGAAAASECARFQNRFWDMHHKLFSQQSLLGRSALENHAESLNLNVIQFKACLDSPDSTQMVREDYREARRLGLTSTPTFMIGRIADDGYLSLQTRINGAQDLSVFQKVLNEALAH